MSVQKPLPPMARPSAQYPRQKLSTIADMETTLAVDASVWTPPIFMRLTPLNRYHLALFFAKVEVDGQGCWLWRAARNNSQAGYGMFQGESAHRTAHRWFVGPIPIGWQVDHLCRHTWCVNPAHLEAVTRSTNVRRAQDATGFCRKGHPWNEHNIVLVTTRRGHKARMCATCYRASKDRDNARRLAERLAKRDVNHVA